MPFSNQDLAKPVKRLLGNMFRGRKTLDVGAG